MASSDRPAGPFTDPVYVTTGFDPAVLVDADGNGDPRVYLYYSREANRDLFACELDPTDMHTILEDSLHYPDTFAEEQPEKSTMLSMHDEPFYFFEGPSIRRVNEWYILSYARSKPFGTNGNGFLSEIGWCYSDNPYGDPTLGEAWTYGGVIVSNRGNEIDNPYYAEEKAAADAYNATLSEKEMKKKGIKVSESFYTNVGNNNHGGMVEIDGQWYQVYHRDTNLNGKRQAMIEPIRFTFDTSGRPVIEEAEMTSQGILSEGMNPTDWHYAQSACYITPQTRTQGKPNAPWIVSNPDGNFDPEADHGDWFPVAGIKDKAWLGFKYFNFGDRVSDALTLNLELIENAAATVNVYCAEPRAKASDPEPEKLLIGTLALAGEDGGPHEVAIPVDAAALSGRKAIYLEFRSEAYDEMTPLEVCQVNRLRFKPMK